MKGSQAARILNAHKHFGHRCWRYTPPRKPGYYGTIETCPTGCNCNASTGHHGFDGMTGIGVARWLRGDIEREQLATALLDLANRPEPE